MARVPEPGDVFTPKAVARREMFTRRNESDLLGIPGVQDRVIDALKERGAQVRVYGDTGVGKTSLVSFAVADAGLQKITVSCMDSSDFPSLMEEAIRKIHGVRIASYKTTRSYESTASASGGAGFLASIKGAFTGKSGKEESFEIIDQSPVDLLMELMDQRGHTVLVLDNFQNVRSDDTRLLVSQLMERFADSCDDGLNLTLVVIGIAHDAKALLGGPGSVRRRTTDVGVPRMPDDEIREIFTSGFRILKFSAAEGVINQLVYFSDGFPFFAHSLGLNIARAARRMQSKKVDAEIFIQGLARCLGEVNETCLEAISLAEEHGGKVQPRKKILEMLAMSKDREWTTSAIHDLWFTHYQSNNVPTLNPAIGQLCKPDNGAILSVRNEKRPFRYQFSDPHYRPILRIRRAQAASQS